jgi:hypothetical protein
MNFSDGTIKTQPSNNLVRNNLLEKRNYYERMNAVALRESG